jgi:hypothetical protein
MAISFKSSSGPRDFLASAGALAIALARRGCELDLRAQTNSWSGRRAKMLRKISGLIPLIGAALAFASAPAFAADYCINLSGPVSSTYVGKDFTPPNAGQCKTWQGFCSQGCSPDNVQTGVACTATNGSHISFGLTTFYLLSNRQFDWIRLDLPSHTGSGNFNYQNPSLGTINYSAKGATCATQSVP